MSFLPDYDREFLRDKGWEYEEKQEGAKRALIIRNFPLPPGKFQVEAVDVLIEIPSGYPDANLDMFWCSPSLYLVPGNRQARQTQVSQDHFGVVWQRWSRHYAQGQWRMGIDNVETHILMVVRELERAE